MNKIVKIPDEKEMKQWLDLNFDAICERAKELQWKLLEKMVKSGLMKKVSTVIGVKVWKNIKICKINEVASRAIHNAIES